MAASRNTRAPAMRGAAPPEYPRPWYRTNPGYQRGEPDTYQRQKNVRDKVTGDVIATKTVTFVEIDGGSFVDVDQFGR